MPAFSNRSDSVVRNILITIIKSYRILLSPMRIQVCRFSPSCSSYAIGAVTVHGTVKGLWLIIKRIVRCNPFCKGGFDPI